MKMENRNGFANIILEFKQERVSLFKKTEILKANLIMIKKNQSIIGKMEIQNLNSLIKNYKRIITQMVI